MHPVGFVLFLEPPWLALQHEVVSVHSLVCLLTLRSCHEAWKGGSVLWVPLFFISVHWFSLTLEQLKKESQSVCNVNTERSEMSFIMCLLESLSLQISKLYGCGFTVKTLVIHELMLSWWVVFILSCIVLCIFMYVFCIISCCLERNYQWPMCTAASSTTKPYISYKSSFLSF